MLFYFRCSPANENSPYVIIYTCLTNGNILFQKNISFSFQQATRTSSVFKKVTLKYSSQYHEVIKAAENWGIKVKSLDAVNQWLNEVEKRMKASQKLRETPRVKRLKGTFLKVEDFRGYEIRRAM